ncbi:MAG: hypothetical protein NTZ16_07780, partial [Verrucomicrobia bacterium]|nr:hypothetical protein [Verrucomicrobiota bacterium]
MKAVHRVCICSLAFLIATGGGLLVAGPTHSPTNPPPAKSPGLDADLEIAQTNFPDDFVIPANADRVCRAAAIVPEVLPDPKDAPPLRLPEAFPIPMTFWSFMRAPADQFAPRLEEQEHYPVVHGVGPYKLENLPRVVKQRWPEKIVIRQSAYGGVGALGGSKVWPGHFLYKVGTKLAHDVRTNDTVLHVANFKCILRNPKELQAREFPLTFTLYALDEKGKPDWNKAEMVTLTAVGAKGELFVKRGAWGTK